ncbi:HlyD family secretion protein [Vibrio alginolyticus]|uniref:HlyD family secretion protein n=1 Tax=Vibrio alginolyticus TaxID=663 RepID=UPI0035544559
MSLFRVQVAESRKKRILGEVSVIQPLSIYLLCIICVLFVLLLFIFLGISSYSTKHTVRGYVVPNSGVIKVLSSGNGIVDKIFVEDGDFVESGQPLLRAKSESTLLNGAQSHKMLEAEIQQQIANLDREIKIGLRVDTYSENYLRQKLDHLSKSRSLVVKALKTSNERVELKRGQYVRSKKIHDRKFISSSQIDTIHGDYLELKEEHEELVQQLNRLEIEVTDVKFELLSIQDKSQLHRIALLTRISEQKERLIKLKSQAETLISAPKSGIVTAIRSNVGSHINSGALLLSIIPEKSQLEVELLLPTYSAGFVRVGDEVRVRYEAFSFQKFGIAKGTVSTIDKALILPSESTFPIDIQEAVYRVRVKIDKQYVLAYGKKIAIKSGMLVEADIIQETRTLFQRILDPIYNVKGRI